MNARAEDPALATKQHIAKSLKELCHTKPLEKISVSDIVAASHINRSTFYYHFADKLELIRWINYQDTEAHFWDVGKDPDAWFKNLLYGLQVTHEDPTFLMGVVRLDREFFRQLIIDICYSRWKVIILQMLGNRQLSEDNLDFLLRSYSTLFAELNLHYLEAGAEENPETEALRYYDLVEPGLRIAVDNMVRRENGQSHGNPLP